MCRAPSERGRAAVLVELGAGEGERAVALEVDDADDVVREAALPVPRDESLPWAAAVARRRGGLVPMQDLEALKERITRRRRVKRSSSPRSRWRGRNSR